MKIITSVHLGALVMVAALRFVLELLVNHFLLDYCHWQLFDVLAMEEVCQPHLVLEVVAYSMEAMVLFL